MERQTDSKALESKEAKQQNNLDEENNDESKKNNDNPESGNTVDDGQKTYKSKVKTILSRGGVEKSDFSERTQVLITHLETLTDDFADWSDKKSKLFDAQLDKLMKHELSGKKVGPAFSQAMNELEEKFKKIEEEDKKKQQSIKEAEEIKAEKQKRQLEHEENLKAVSKVEGYIDSLFDQGKDPIITKSKLKSLGFNPVDEEFIVADKYRLTEDDWWYEYDIEKIKKS